MTRPRNLIPSFRIYRDRHPEFGTVTAYEMTWLGVTVGISIARRAA